MHCGNVISQFVTSVKVSPKQNNTKRMNIGMHRYKMHNIVTSRDK